MITLRPYQEAAKAAVYEHLRNREDNPCVVIPTAGGKTPVMASICKDAVGLWDGRVLILAHVKELLEQTTDKLTQVCPEVDFGVYSAGLGRRDTEHSVIVAGIQSVYKRACDLGSFNLVIVDESHLIPPDGEGMYQQFLADTRVINPEVRVIGLTATPFRLKSGMICGPDNILNAVCYEVGVRELIRDGYLCPLVTKAGREKADTQQLHVRGGEFVAGEVEDLMDQDLLVMAACSEIVSVAHNRRSCLIFASGVKHGQHVARVLADMSGHECGFVCGDTPTKERDELLGRFRSGELRYLANVNVLTTGFDAPNIDCVALLRPTMSPGLFYQMCGRGFRLHPDKHNCLVLDFGGNVLRHGPVDQIRVREPAGTGNGEAPAKECPECQALIAAGYAKCPVCGYVFPPPERQKHDAKASEAGILSGQVTDVEYDVQDITYNVHTKRGAPDDAPRTFRVDYRLGLNHWQSEFVCLEHDGYARQKAIAWWRQRSPDPIPEAAERAVEIAEGGGLAHTEKITVRSIAGEKYDRIVRHKLGPLPEPIPAGEFIPYDPDEIPF
ncbi:MAG: DEAD/DEAH box helicase family protein [Pirellulales bacterium]|nr:DEAD/DEAH box helicase family protein [Pirellulales bacterium]